MKKLMEQYLDDAKAFRSHKVSGISTEEVHLDPHEFLALTEKASDHSAQEHAQNSADVTALLCQVLDAVSECPLVSLGALLAVAYIQIKAMKLALHEEGAQDALAKLKDILKSCDDNKKGER